jgi:hypothetical protein
VEQRSNYCSLLYPYGSINKPHSQHVLIRDRWKINLERNLSPFSEISAISIISLSISKFILPFNRQHIHKNPCANNNCVAPCQPLSFWKRRLNKSMGKKLLMDPDYRISTSHWTGSLNAPNCLAGDFSGVI